MAPNGWANRQGEYEARQRRTINALTVTRFTLPPAETLVDGIDAVQLDLELETNAEEKRRLQDAKASKTWRALRLASKTKLSLFDKVEDGRNLHCFVEAGPHGGSNIEGGEMTAEGGGKEA